MTSAHGIWVARTWGTKGALESNVCAQGSSPGGLRDQAPSARAHQLPGGACVDEKGCAG